MARLSELLSYGIRELEGASPSPGLDASVLLRFSCSCSSEFILANPEHRPSEEQRRLYYGLIRRRIEHEPVAYLTGEKEFWSLSFKVGPEVLVPRPETELLVEKPLKRVSSRAGKIEVLELGSGSGCISVALAHELKKMKRNFTIVALDSSPEALRTAGENAKRHLVDDFIAFEESDWFSALGADRRFHLIVSNPPYIAKDAVDLSPEVAFEPRQALFAEDAGFADIAYLMKEAPKYLSRGGSFFCEIGSGQAPLVKTLFDALYVSDAAGSISLTFHRDLAGIERVFEISLD